MENLLKELRADLLSSSDKKAYISFQRFFKEEVSCYGMKSAEVGRIAKKYDKRVKELSKQNFFKFCEELYKSDYCEEAFLVSGWASMRSDEYVEEDIKLFEKWIDKYINNWAKCDGFCNQTIGKMIEKFPNKLSILFEWAKSPNLWVRRAAAVSLIIPAKQGKYLSEAFKISDILLEDNKDMVQKGYGWLLKEESRKHEKEVLDYVMKNKKVMPRTALRYAIELMPKELRQKAMGK